jgi:ketosteroid isomerase-like protein
MAATAADSEIRKVLEQVLDAMNAGDRDRLRSFLAQRPDALHIGTDPDEWMTSEEMVATLGNVETLSVKAVLDDITVDGETNDVAWAVGHAHFESGSIRSQPVRITAVLVRDGNRWTVVHSHASIGVPNSELFG